MKTIVILVSTMIVAGCAGFTGSLTTDEGTVTFRPDGTVGVTIDARSGK